MPPLPIRSVVFWYDAPTVHQFGLIGALAAGGRLNVTVVTARDLSRSRREMGWDEPDFGSASRVRSPTPADRDALLSAHSDPDSLHVFSGLRAFPSVYRAFSAASTTGARIAVMAIGPDPRGVRGLLRQFAYRVDAVRFRRRVNLFLALGETGAAWYRAVGFSESQVYTFANFTSAPPPATEHRDRATRFRIVFVGALLELKGVHVLLRALAELDRRDWELVILGDGPARATCEALCDRLGLTERVQWIGFRPHTRVFEILADADLCVLPSYHDGWGSVVNEALLSGVPVVCTESCGAALIVRASGCGATVRPGRVRELSAAIEAQMALGHRRPADRASLASWAACITPQRGAAYFESILAHAFGDSEPPLPPWERR